MKTAKITWWDEINEVEIIKTMKIYGEFCFVHRIPGTNYYRVSHYETGCGIFGHHALTPNAAVQAARRKIKKEGHEKFKETIQKALAETGIINPIEMEVEE